MSGRNIFRPSNDAEPHWTAKVIEAYKVKGEPNAYIVTWRAVAMTSHVAVTETKSVKIYGMRDGAFYRPLAPWPGWLRVTSAERDVIAVALDEIAEPYEDMP